MDTTTTLSQTVSTYYVKRFLSRANDYLVHKEGAQMRKQPAGEGHKVRFSRYAKLDDAITPLTEGTNPGEDNLSAVNVDVDLKEYGNTVKLSRFLSLTDIDVRDREKIDVVSENMGRTLDSLTRNELVTGATQKQFAGSGAAVTDVSATDTLSAEELRKAVRTLEEKGAHKYSGRGQWIGKIQPATKFDFTGDATWENAKVYSDVEDLYLNEVGMMHGIRLLLSNNGHSADEGAGASGSEATVYSNFIHGKEAFGVVNLAGDPPKLFIVPHTKIDSGNPAGRSSKISWAGSYATKVLNPDWIVDIKTGATA